VGTGMQKAIVYCCNFATTSGKTKDVMTLSPEVDVIVVNSFYLVERCSKNFF